MTLTVHGACHCGRIAYEAEVDPSQVRLCHCTDCQVLSGSAWRVSVPSLPGSLRLLRGAPKAYVKTADSGNRRRHSFCPDCGSPVYASADTDTPAAFTLRVGALAERAQLPPKSRIWCQSALDWGMDVSAVPGVAGQ
jgi:hypothetical protein